MYKGNQKSNEPKNDLFYIHAFILWAFLMETTHSVEMLAWSIAYSSSIKSHFYIAIGPMPNWLNLTTWGLYILLGVIGMFVVIGMALRYEKARKLFMITMPVLLVSSGIEIWKDFYQDGLGLQDPLLVTVVAVIFYSVIQIAILYYFYSKENVKKIFVA